MAAISSFCGGTIGLIGLTFAASALARVALSFGKVEFFAIVVFGLVLLTTISGKNQLKGLIVVCLGVILGCVGLDDLYGTLRFTYGVVDLYKGISFVTFIMGVYGITELMSAICIPENQGEVADFNLRVSDRSIRPLADAASWDSEWVWCPEQAPPLPPFSPMEWSAP